jgi:DNA-damage-inducible protein J
MFIKSVINEHRIPFEVREPIARYNAKANDIEALKKGIEQLNAGKGIVKTLEELEAMENG